MELSRTKNVATYVVFPIKKTDGTNISGAAGLDSEIDSWNDGAAPDGFADCANEATEIGSTGIYYLSLAQAEMNYDYIVIQIKSSSTGAIPQIIIINTKERAEIAAIKAKTDNLPADPADDSDIDTQLATIAGYLDTEVAAIKAKTDLIPASPAQEGTLTKLDTALELDGAVYRFTTNALEQSPTGSGGFTSDDRTTLEAVKAKTDNLPADPGDQSAVEAAIVAAHATTDALISSITGGGGLAEKTYTLTDATTGLPLVGVQVWATTDEAGLNQVDITRTTNDAGQVTFRINLVAGTPIYIWNRYMAEGDVPDEEEV